MAQIVCIIGNKGGTGKTTVSHMLARGLGQLRQRSVCVLTDPAREPLDPSGRRYLIADARSRQVLAKVIDKIRELPGWMGVVDGGANRSQVDRELYAIADLVLLPFRDSHEDMRTVIRATWVTPNAELFSSTACTARSTSLLLLDSVTKAAAPSLAARVCVAPSSRAEMTITGSVGWRLRSTVRKPNPLIPGSIRSGSTSATSS